MSTTHQVASCLPSLSTGIPSMVSIISSVVTAGIGFGLGWYIKGRGMTGVQIDLNNIKNDVENLKAKIFPSTVSTTVA